MVFAHCKSRGKARRIKKNRKKKVSVSRVPQSCVRIEFSSLRVTFSHGRNSLQNKLFLVPLLERTLNCQERGSRGETWIDSQLYCQRQRTRFQNQRAKQGMNLQFCCARLNGTGKAVSHSISGIGADTKNEVLSIVWLLVGGHMSMTC